MNHRCGTKTGERVIHINDLALLLFRSGITDLDDAEVSYL
jgi:hypothetical protein